MEKGMKIIKILSLLLIAVLIIVLAFFGFHKKVFNIWNNLIPDYNYGIELKGLRELRYVVDTSEEEKNVYVDSEGNILGVVKENVDSENIESDTDVSLETDENTVETEDTENTDESENEESPIAELESDKVNYATELRVIKANEDHILTIENFEKTKKIIQKRLESRDAYEYNIRLDNVTGELIVELPDDKNTNLIAEMIYTVGKIEIIDEQTGIILMDNSHIKNAKAMYSSDQYQAYLQLEFTKEGKEILRQISNEYKKVTNEAGEETTNYISLTLDDLKLVTTYFGSEISDGILQISIGNSITDFETYRATSESLENIVDIINSGKMPVKYVLSSDNFIQSNITSNEINIAKTVFLVVIALISVYLIFAYKLKGFLGAVLCAGYIGLVILAVRYTNVYITTSSIVAFIVAILVNYVFMIKMLYKMKNDKNSNEAFLEAIKELYLAIIPLCIIAVVFTLMKSITISSFGMTLFWGMIILAIYNTLITRAIYKSVE